MVARSILQKQEIQQQQQKMSNVKQNQACLQQLHRSSTLVGSPYNGPSSVSAEADSVKESSSTQKTASSYPISTASFGYYYPGYGSFLGGLDTKSQMYYTMEVQYPVMQADNGSFFYAIPGLHPSYDTYSLCSNLTTIGVEGQYVSEQMYSSSPMLHSAIASNGYNSTSIPYGQVVSSPYLSDPSLLVGYGYNFSNPRHANDPPKSKSSFDAISGQNNKLRPLNKASSPNLKSDMMAKGSYADAKYPVNNLVNVKEHGKLKNRSKISSVCDLNSLINEKKHGSGLTNATDAIKFQCNAISSLDTDNNKTCLVRRDQYNLPEFKIKHDDAYFFVIKSYSEDDIHRSIKYNVWASTPNGNKRLDSAYQNAQEKIAQKGIKCPVFLLFSVNASGQFCGVAEMIGQVDFGKNMNFWQQDKWNGSFPVKWHIIKDIPNSQLRHIILENNESKPVTNSRDTQEVKFKEGIEMLSIFKNYVSSTSIIDDFGFYECRQKALQEKKDQTISSTLL